MKRISDEQLIMHLKNMPKVHDRLSQEEWKERVEPDAYKLQRQRIRKRPKMIPILSTALMFGILLLIIPSLFDRQSSTLEEPAATSEMNMDSKELSTILSEQDEEQTTTVENHQHEMEDRGEYVLYNVLDDEQLVYGGTIDQQAQFLIPLTFITSNDLSLNDAYNTLDTFVENVEGSRSLPYFKEVTFEINEEEAEVIMHTSPDYSIGEGSALPGKFEEMLTIMFAPYGIEKVFFKQLFGEPVFLEAIGEIDELAIREPVQSNYKLYNDGASEQSLLIPVQQEGVSFSDAVEDLKNSDSDYLIQQTIPEDVHLTIECDENSCTVDFGERIEQLSEEEMVIAVESILMTAKSYGYSELQFNGLSNHPIGGYDFSQPIDVPLAVNPVQINE